VIEPFRKYALAQPSAGSNVHFSNYNVNWSDLTQSLDRHTSNCSFVLSWMILFARNKTDCALRDKAPSL